MAGKLSFSIAINLLTENFKRGTNQVKSAFRSMQAQILTFVAALGAGGLGLSNLITRFIEVARETSRVTTSLKNVSGSMAQFADNQKFLLDMAQKYGLEINALTGNYAKFTAAASISGISMEEQRKIFESMSRAVTAFGMSADDSNGVFMALSQMMSKGKISSEELRLQMGERLPIALQAMAKAAGVSVAGLDKLLKQGKLMSADVLPKFADALNEMIPNVDTDNLETSVNRLKNMFTEVVNSSGIQGSYKALIDWLTEAIKTAAENIRDIIIGLLALITGSIANHVVKWWTNISNLTVALEANAAKSNAVLLQATQQRIAAEIALEKAKTQSVAAEKAARIALDRALQKEQLALAQVASAEQKAADMKKVVDAQTTAKLMIKATQERVAAEIALETAKSELVAAQNANRQAQTYNETLAIRTRLQAAQTNFASAEKTLAEKTAKEVAAQEAAKAAAANASAVKSQGAWVRFCNTTKVAVGKLVISLRTLWSTFAPMAIISALIWIVAKFSSVRKEAEEIAAIYSSFKNGAKSASNTQEIIQLRVLQDLYNKAAEGSKLKEKYQNRIVELLGGELEKNQSINDAVRERIKLLEATAKTDYYTQKRISAQDELNQIASKYGGFKGYGEETRKQAKFEAKRHKLDNWANDFNPVTQDRNRVNQLVKIINESDKEIRANTEYVIKKTPVKPTTDPDGTPDDKKTELQKLEEKHAQSIRELTVRREVEKMTLDEYNKAYDELKKSALIEAKSSSDKKVLTSEYIKGLQKAVDNPLYGSVQAELTKIEDEYTKTTVLAKAKLDKKLITEDEYRQSLIDAATSAANAAISIDGIGDTADGFIKKMQGVVGDNLKIETPKLKQRDTTFDYNKTDIDKQSENVDIWIEYRDNLKEKLAEAKDKGSALAISLQSDLDNAIANITDFEKALKIAQVKQDIKDLSKEIGNMKWDGIKSAVSSVEGIVSAFERLKEAFDPDSEADGWERLMALWNSMTSVIDGIMSVIQTIENITELTNKLTEAKQKEVELDKGKIIIDNLAANTKVTNDTKEIVSDTVTAEVKKDNSRGVVMANTAEAATAAGKSVAGIPIVGIALAAAAIGAIVAMFGSIAKFAGGGIITGGSKSGDKILARVNAGEMILNGSQQSNLFDAINSGKLGGGSSIIVTGEAKLRGDTAFLQMSNYMKRTGKKLP